MKRGIMAFGVKDRRRRSVEERVRRTILILAVALSLGGCGWFGHKGDEEAAKADTGPAVSSDEVLKKDCSDENWKQQNLGLWYSVCRQPMKW
jgi:hypothetical protein